MRSLSKILLVILLIALIVAIITFFTFGYPLAKKMILNDKTPLQIFLIQKANSFFNVVDEINIFAFKKNLLDGTLPVYNLKLSKNDLDFFANVSEVSKEKGYLSSSINKWREAKLSYNNEWYDVKVKLRGDRPAHWEDNLKSYTVKLESGSINGITTINLILFEERALTGKMTKILANGLNLYNIRDDIVVVKINGVLQGVYYLQEDLGADLLENNKCSSCVLIKTTDNWAEDHPRAAYNNLNGITKGMDHGTDFDNEISNMALKDSSLNRKALFVLENIFEKVKDNNLDYVADYFDYDQLSRLEALELLIGSNHFIRGDNLKLAYSASTAKFYPIPMNEEFKLLILENGGVEHSLSENVPLFKLLGYDDEIRQARNKIVYEYLSNSNPLGEIDSMVEQYLPYALSYKTNALSRMFIKTRIKKERDSLALNIDLIKRNLEYAACYLNFFEKGNELQIEVIPDSISQINFNLLRVNLANSYKGEIIFKYTTENNETKFIKKEITEEESSIDLTEFVEGLYFSAGLDDEMYPIKRTYPFEIIFSDAELIILNSVEVKMSNDITGKEIKAEDLYFQIADGNNYAADSRYLSFNEFQKSYPFFNWNYEDNDLTLLAGNYVLTDNLIIPEFNEFKIEAGTTISLKKDRSIISYSPVRVEGTESSPVIIKAFNPQEPFGTFGMLGNNDKEVVINWLDLSGGNETIINGIYFSGGLSIYNFKTVTLKNTKIHHNHADDGLNIKYNQVYVDNSQFYDNFADQFDCDFCEGVVENSVFTEGAGGGYDDNGDGLDFSGSRMLIKNNQFSSFLDKGLSIGEDTEAVIFDNSILGNNIGIAVKDHSNVFMINNKFSENNVAVDTYQKKPLFGGGFSYSYGNSFNSNKVKYKNDDYSKNYEIKIPEDIKTNIVKGIASEDLELLFSALSTFQQQGGNPNGSIKE